MGRTEWHSLLKRKSIAAAAAVASCLLTSAAQAASCGNSAAGFEQWKVQFADKAKAAGVKQKGLAALAGAKYATGTIRADRSSKQAFSGSVDAFMNRRGGSAIISKGRSLKKANAALFDKIERTYGVPPGYCSPSGAWRPASAPPWASRTPFRRS